MTLKRKTEVGFTTNFLLARHAMFNYIEMFYNPKRRHTHNDRVPPTVYEQRYLMNLESV